MMQLSKILSAAGLAAIFAVSANAAPVVGVTDNLGIVGSSSWLTTGDGNLQTYFGGTASSSGLTDVYTFTLNQPASFYSQVFSSTPTSKNSGVASYSWSLYDGSTQVASGSSAGASLNYASFVALSGGHYTLDVTAVSTSANSNFSGVIDIAPTPIPAALPLFGSALIGLGLFGRRRRKTNISAV
jgi:hypothetical protein